jgi:hypothetical protein
MSNGFVDIHISQLPSEWGQLVQLNYLAQLQATKVAGDTATTANGTATQAKQEVEQQSGVVSSLSKKVTLQDQQIKSNTQKSTNAANSANSALQVANQTKQDLETHEQSDSVHGVTGEVVGTEDYAQELIGGVVLLASKVNSITQKTVSIGDAPATYDQAHEQSVVDAVRSLANKQNDIIGKVNELIKALQDAKQMQSNP